MRSVFLSSRVTAPFWTQAMKSADASAPMLSSNADASVLPVILVPSLEMSLSSGCLILGTVIPISRKELP